MIVGVAVLTSNTLRAPPKIDREIVVAVAERQGHLPPEAAEALREQVARTQANLDTLREHHPDWAQKIDRAINGYNRGKIDNSRSSFEQIDRRIAEHLAELGSLAARSKYAQAILFYPFELSKAEPLICDAAELAVSETFYWLECGRVRRTVSTDDRTLQAYQKARDLAVAHDQPYERSVALIEIGYLNFSQGQLGVALDLFNESLKIAEQESGDDRFDHTTWDAYLGVGDVRFALGDRNQAFEAFKDSLAVAERRVELEPANASWAKKRQVSLTRVADVHLRDRSFDSALESYSDALDALKELKQQYPDNISLKRSIAVSLNKVGETQFRSGQREEAVKSFSESLKLRRDLAEIDPGNAMWTRDVVSALWALAQIDPTDTTEHWSALVYWINEMEKNMPLTASEQQVRHIAQQRIDSASE